MLLKDTLKNIQMNWRKIQKKNRCDNMDNGGTPAIVLRYLILTKRRNMNKQKKDDSTNKDEFVNCRCCGEYIQGDSRSSSDKRYCSDCA